MILGSDPGHCYTTMLAPLDIVIGQPVNILGPETLSTNVDSFPVPCLRCPPPSPPLIFHCSQQRRGPMLESLVAET
jgi:hypothetical protein